MLDTANATEIAESDSWRPADPAAPQLSPRAQAIVTVAIAFAALDDHPCAAVMLPFSAENAAAILELGGDKRRHLNGREHYSVDVPGGVEVWTLGPEVVS